MKKENARLPDSNNLGTRSYLPHSVLIECIIAKFQIDVSAQRTCSR